MDIEQKRIYYAHNIKTCDGAPCPKQTPPPANKISSDALNYVSKHIMSFQKVESHYCLSKTSREHVDSSLNLQKTFELYEEKYRFDSKKPVGETVFKTEFNLAFHVPKCDRCEEVRVA